MSLVMFDNYLLHYALNRLTNTHADSADFAQNQCVTIYFESCLLENHTVMVFLKAEFAYSTPTRFQGVKNMQVILKLMDNVLQNDTVNLVQYRMLLLKFWQNTILELMILQAIVIDATAFVEATEKFTFNSFAWIQPKTVYLNHFVL